MGGEVGRNKKRPAKERSPDEILSALGAVDCASLNYGEWLAVGQALKHEGLPIEAWEEWSARDSARYHPGECMKKWNSFAGSQTPVTGASIFQMAYRAGWRHAAGEGRDPSRGSAPGAGVDRGGEAFAPPPVPRAGGKEPRVGATEQLAAIASAAAGFPAQTQARWDRVSSGAEESPEELKRYLEALFAPGEFFGFQLESFVDRDGKRKPKGAGVWSLKAGDVGRALSSGSVGDALGDCSPEGGAWIRINPLDGQGASDKNVAAYRWALVEFDEGETSEQLAAIKASGFPVSAIVHSGGKSVHAIAAIGAPDYETWRARAAKVYAAAEASGLRPDPQNKNPSRFSRMPGVTRSGKRQALLYSSPDVLARAEEAYLDWEGGGELPAPIELETALSSPPPLGAELIEGVLRAGHKMILSAPSKAGKSFFFIELCCAMSMGAPFLGRRTLKGRALYINLEIDAASCLDRYGKVIAQMGADQKNVDVWNLRGSAMQMSRLAGEAVKRSPKGKYSAIIIDPLYKAMEGDENSAGDMAALCNSFDRICSLTGAAVIYSHHHSKSASGYARAMDRASGSGVFARDPDAVGDLSELEVSEEMREAFAARQRAAFLERFALENGIRPSWGEEAGPSAIMAKIKAALPISAWMEADRESERVRKKALAASAWRLDFTTREFAKPPADCLWFDYPMHFLGGEELGEAKEKGAGNVDRTNSEQSRRKQSRQSQLAQAWKSVAQASADGKVSVAELADRFDVSEKTIKRDAWKSGFSVRDGFIEQ
jgi:RecA-family ATPase